MSTLERAIAIAAQAHAGQVDKGGAPYVLHPLRVMLSVSGIDAQIAAVLHDLVEDCAPLGWDLERLRAEGFAERVVAAVDALTKRPDERGKDWPSYERAILRAAADPIARRVKLADLADNLDLSRLPHPTRNDLDRLARYRRAVVVLEAAAVCVADSGPPVATGAGG